MPDGAAGIAVVRGSIRFRIERGRLQDAGWKVDVIHLRIVVGVHGGRSHGPLAPVNGLADFRELPVEFELSCPVHIAQLVAAHDLKFAVVAPFVRVANLVGYAMQFC